MNPAAARGSGLGEETRGVNLRQLLFSCEN